ncbi:Pre-mRNA splicing factor PRP21 like protein-domain-containing protein [Flagelloscypha sp. PMI_526]|nr:Pre-mRNA splicing factor PRP21 like protein-domain-containing protein [Flagelloscypha sp. PMI_526]
MGDRFATGMILPPPEIKAVIDKTATFIARSANPPQFEEKIRDGQRNDPKFSFLNPADPYHQYYRHKTERVMQGHTDESDQPKDDKVVGQKEAATPTVDRGIEPPAPKFILDFPPLSPIDLDIIKLTALFTAQRGRSFLSALSAREGHNFQFEFLRQNHSLFGYFNRLVDQYTRVLDPDKDTLEQLKERSQPDGKWKTLELARRHAKWKRFKRETDKQREDDQEAERIAFAEIDWHDYAIVQTIEFTAADANSELPPPMSVQEVENMTLAQKRMAAMIMENTADDVEAHRAKQAAADAASGNNDDMEVDDEKEAEERRKKEEAERLREIERARALQASSMNAGGAVKIRTDYVPKVRVKNAQVNMATCPNCGQQIPVDQLQEHMRIELLDPRWKEQRDVLESRKAQASELQRGADVSSSLRNLARTRTDIFGAEADEERRKLEEEQEKERRKEREKAVWDGHTASKAGTLDTYSTRVNFDEQIAAIHRAKGLVKMPTRWDLALVRQVNPGQPPPVGVPLQAASNPAFTAATISSGPQPASAYSQTPVMLPPLHYQGMNAPQPFGYQPPPAGPQPTRQAALEAANNALKAGQVRSADEMEGATDEIPPAKRQRVNKMPGAQICTEEDWITMHPAPISLFVQLPSDPSKPEWKLDGTTIKVSDIPMNFRVSSLRDRILQATGSTLSASRIRLSYCGKMLTNANTIALYNMEDEELVHLTVSAAKKK